MAFRRSSPHEGFGDCAPSERPSLDLEQSLKLISGCPIHLHPLHGCAYCKVSRHPSRDLGFEIHSEKGLIVCCFLYSMVARSISRVPILGRLVGLVLGKGGRELGATEADGRHWANPPQPCGVIAGTKKWTLLNPVGWVSNGFKIIDSPNDGTIALQETRLPAELMTDFTTVYAGHTAIQNNTEVQRLTTNFILSQKF